MAMEELRTALESNPNDTRTFQTELEPILKDADRERFDEFLEVVLATVNQEDALINLMRAADLKAKTVGGDIQEYVSYRVGKVFLDFIGNEDMAEMYFRRLPAGSPFVAELHDFYVQFYVKKQNWRKLEQLFLDEATAQGDPDPDTASKRQAARLAKSTDNAQRALTYWQAIRKQYPEDVESQDELLVLYRETEKWHQVAELLKAKADALPEQDADEKVALYEEMIPIFRDKMNMEAKVSAAYQSILEIQPNNRGAFDALCLHYEGSNRIPDLVKLLKARVETEEDLDERFALLGRIGTIMEGQFSNVTEAIKTYEMMRELRPEDLDVLLKLKALYEQRRDWGHYIEVAREELAFVDGRERFAKLQQLARLALENIREMEIGVALWQEVREVEPADKEAFEALSNLFERGKEYEGLATLLEERLDQVEDEERLAILERLALLYSTRVKDSERAAEAWKRLLQLSPDNHRARAELKKLLVRAKDIEGIDSFFRVYGTLTDYARTLELMVKEEEEAVVRVQLLFRMAALYLEEDGNEDRARKALEQVLEEDAVNVQAAELLLDIYQALSRFEDLVRVQDLILTHKTNLTESERLDLLLKKASVHEHQLRQLDEAFFTFIQAYQLDWQRPDVYQELERLASVSDNWATFISVLEGTVSLVDADQDKVPYLVRIGEIWEQQLADAQNAVQSFQDVLAIDSANKAALTALQRLFLEQEQWKPYRDIVKKTLDVEGDPMERKRLLRAWGDVCLDRLADTTEAAEAFRQLTTEFPVLVEGYDRLTQVLLFEERHEELLEVLEVRLSALHPQGRELSDLLVDIGMLQYGVRESIHAAVTQYVEALEVDPENERAVSLLQELVSDEDSQLVIVNALSTVYELREAWAPLADALELKARWLTGEDHRELLVRLQGLYGRMDQPSLAARTVRRLFRLNPEDQALKLALEELSEVTGEWTAVVELYADQVDEVADEEYRHELLRSAAEIHHQRLDDRATARALYRRVLDENPTDAVAIAALEAIAIEEEDWSGLLGIYESRLAIETESGQRIAVLFCVANLARDHLSDASRASEAVEQILDLETSNMEALALLDQLYTEQERWKDLLNILEQTANLVDDNEVKASLLIRVAELFEQRLDNPEEMVERLRLVIELDPMNDKAVEILDRNIRGDIAIPVLDLLESQSRFVEDYPRLTQQLETRKDFVSDEAERVELQKEIARIYEENRQDPQTAFAKYKDALAMDPNDDGTLEHLLSLSTTLANADELFTVLDDQAGKMDPSPQQVKMWRTLASIGEDHLGDGDISIQYLSRVVEHEPEDLASVLTLERLYKERERFADLAAIFDAHVALIDDVEQKKELLLEAGQLFQGVLENPEEAILRYEQLLELDPRDVAGLASLQNLYEETQRYDDLEQILERRAVQTEDDAEKRGLLLRRSEVLEQDLERLEDANMVLSGLFRSDETDLEVVERLEALHEKREDWLSLLDVLNHKLELAMGEEQIPILLKIARVQAVHLEDLHSANTTYRRLLELFPAQTGAVEELEKIVLQKEEKDESFAILRPILEEQGEWERLLLCMESLSNSLEDDPYRRISVLQEMVHISDVQTENLPRSFLLASQALGLNPQRLDIADILEDLAGRADLLEDLVTVYTEIAQGVDVPEEAIPLRLRVGRLLKDRITDVARAIVQYEALREDTEEPEVLSALDDLYEISESWELLVGILRARVDATVPLEDKLELLYRLAGLHETHLEQPTNAMEVLKEAHLLDSGNLRTLQQMRRLYDSDVPDVEAADYLESYYSMHDEWAEVAHVVRRRFELAQDKPVRLELALKLVNVFLDKLQNRPNALISLGEALELDPEDMGNLDLFLRLMEETGLEAEGVNYLQLARVEAESDDAFRRLSMETGRICFQLGQVEDAEVAFRDVIERDETALAAYRELEKLMDSQERRRDQEQLLETMVELEDYDDEKIALLGKLGQLRRDVLDEPEKAILAYEKVVELDDHNEEALESLSYLYELGENYEALVKILRGLVDLSQQTDERVNLLSRLAIIHENNLSDRDTALSCWQEVLDWSPTDTSVMGQLERLYVATEDWQSFLEMADREVRVEQTSPERRLELWRLMARAALDELDDPISAQTHWESVRGAASRDLEALASLRSLYRRNEDFGRLAELLLAMADDEDRGEEERLETLRELGQLKMEEVMDPEGAIAAFRRVRDIDPTAMDAYNALEKLYLDSMKVQECVDLLHDKLELVDEDEEKVRLLDRVATLQEETLNEWEESAETRKKILVLRQGDLEQLERIAGIYEMHGRWDSLALTLEERLPFETSDKARGELLTQLAMLYEEKLSDDTLAMNAIVRSVEPLPGDGDLISMGERIARRSSLWDDLRVLWSKSVDHVEPDQQVELLLKLGTLLRDELNRPLKAIDWYEMALVVNDEEESALVALVELYEAAANWEKLVERLGQLARVTPDFAKQVAYFLQLGDVFAEQLGDPDKAQEAYANALELDPNELRAVDALQRLYTESENWEKLIEVLTIRTAIEPARDSELKLISGSILESQIGDPMRAAEVYEDLVTFDPSQAEAFARLERIYKEHEKWDKLLETYEKLLSVTGPLDDRIQILRSMALLSETALDNREAAADYYQQIMDVRPEDREAMDSLETLYEEQERYDDLVLVLRRIVDLAETVQEKVDNLRKVASIYVEKLDDLGSATMTYRELLELDPGHMETLEKLELLYGEQGDWMEVQSVLEQRLKLASSEEEMRALFLRRGDIYRDELLLTDKAREQYENAADFDEKGGEAMERLIALYEADEDWRKVVEVLLNQVKKVKADEDKALMLARMGQVMLEKLDDQEGAVGVLEMALEKMPRLPEAISPLADIYLQRSEWAKAYPLLQILLESPAGASPEGKGLFRKMAIVASNTGQKDMAIEFFRRAYDQDPDDLEVIEGLSRAYVDTGKYAEAQTYLANLLEKGEDQFTIEKRVGIVRLLGDVAMKLGRLDDARKYFDQVLELQPEDTQVLNELATLMASYEDWESAISYWKAIGDLLPDGPEKWRTLIAIGDTYREKLENMDEAMDAYKEALLVQPNSRPALVKLLEIHINAESFSEALTVLEHLIAVEANPEMKASYTFSMATICREKLQDLERAVDYYEQTLDLNYSKLEAFQAVDEILTQLKEWESLESTYRRMIARVRNKGMEKLEFTLYKNLGEIYRSRLKLWDMAASSYELASRLQPQDMAIREILVELYGKLGNRDKVLNELRAVLAIEPERMDLYRQLATTLLEMDRDDDAWFALSVLNMGRKTTPEDQQILERKRTTSVPSGTRAVDRGLWVKGLFSKLDDPHLGHVYQTLYQAVGAYLGGRDPKELGLKKKDELDMTQKTMFTTVATTVSRILGVPLPRIYVSERKFGINIEGTMPPVIVIGMDMLRGKTEKELAFVLGKHLAYFHPMHILAACYPAAVLKMFWQVAGRFAHGEFPVDKADDEQFVSLLNMLKKHASPQLANTLVNSVDHFVKKGESPRVGQWLTGVELTANHAGLLACMDLDVAANVLRTESVSFSKLAPKEKAKELFLYANSEEFADLRKALGLTLKD